MKRQLIAFLAPLAFALPAFADWPDNARDNFISECVETTQLEHSPAKAQAFCECAADEVEKDLSSDELEAMGGEAVDPAIQERLITAAQSCTNELE
ncbi:hypothetical protein [Halopseudomonas pelagia]|uniref:hypothetical protein n=1 Tax=Halopseudomonas pelagia TaxID=553151 RepID=UPI0003A82D92|nr:hypothetical protein [Halopseudomonas pelagia]|tara:strand:+ start:1615 stop:1902 length:288 start_codon:yes stop_codon:yes gene_type:complete